MLAGLYSAAAGLGAQQQQLDAVGNDIANSSTPGYRSERTAFSDLLYSTANLTGDEATVGAGAKLQPLGASRAQGAMRVTGDPFDLAIQGEGFFELTRANGAKSLTRDGSFSLDASGTLVASDGSRLTPPVKIPAGLSAADVHIGPEGAVTAAGRTLGQIRLFTVPAPDRLLSDGAGGFTATAASGAPAQTSKARIQQGALEGSNVDLGREMSQMISSERSFQMASSAIQNESQMLTIANQLRPA